MPEKTQSRVDKAVEYFNGGANCAQSVVMAYCDLFGLTVEQGAAVAAGYGGGIAGTHGMCGTVNGMIILAGLKFGGGKERARLYKTVVAMLDDFKAVTSTDNCNALLANVNDLTLPEMIKSDTKEFKRPCAKFVVLSCNIIEKRLLIG